MFAVVWSDEAFDQMDRVIRDHPSRKVEFAVALGILTDRLTRDPASEGESRWHDVRVTFLRPLTVYFRVDEESETVEIAQIELVK